MDDDRIIWYEMEMIRIGRKDDPSIAHYEADELLIALLRELGYDSLADLFKKMEKWYE